MSTPSGQVVKGPSRDEFDFLLSNIDWRRSLQAASSTPLGSLVVKCVKDREGYNTEAASLADAVLKGGMRSARTIIETITYVLVATSFRPKSKCLALELLKHVINTDKTYGVAVTSSINIVPLLRSISQSSSQRDFVLSHILSDADLRAPMVGAIISDAREFVKFWDSSGFETSPLNLGLYDSTSLATTPASSSVDVLAKRHSSILKSAFVTEVAVGAPPSDSRQTTSGRTGNRSNRSNRSDPKSKARAAATAASAPAVPGRGPLGTKLDNAQELVKTMQDAIASNPEDPDGLKLLGDIRQGLSKANEELQQEAGKAVDADRMADFTRITRVVDDVNMSVQMYDAYMEKVQNTDNKRLSVSKASNAPSSSSGKAKAGRSAPAELLPSHHSSMDLPGGFQPPSSWVAAESVDFTRSSPDPPQLFEPTNQDPIFEWSAPVSPKEAESAPPQPPSGKKRSRSKRKADTGGAGGLSWQEEDRASQTESQKLPSSPQGGDKASVKSSFKSSVKSSVHSTSQPFPWEDKAEPALNNSRPTQSASEAGKIAALEAMVNRLLSEKHHFESEIKTLSNQLTTCRLELEDKEATIKEMKREHDRTKKELSKAKLAVTDAEKALSHAKEMWLRENSRASALNASLDEKEAQLLNRDVKVKELKVELEASQRRLSHLEYLLSRQEKTIQQTSTSGRRFSEDRGYSDDEEDDSAHASDFRRPSPDLHQSTRSRRNMTSVETTATSVAASFYGRTEISRFSEHFRTTENLVRFRHLLSVDEGILHVEANVLEIGVRSVYDGTLNTTRIYFGNLSNGILDNFSASVTYFDWDPLGTGAKEDEEIVNNRAKYNSWENALRWTASPVPNAIVQGQQICQSLVLECMLPYTFLPMLVVKFLLPDATPRLLNLLLPFPVTKFVSPLRLGAVEFFKRWKNYQFVASEVSSVMMLRPALLSPLSNLIKAIQLEGSLELHLGLDSDPNNLVLAGTYPPLGNPSIPLSTVLVRVEVGSGRSAGKGRIAVRSDSRELADGTRRVLVALCAVH